MTLGKSIVEFHFIPKKYVKFISRSAEKYINIYLFISQRLFRSYCWKRLQKEKKRGLSPDIGWSEKKGEKRKFRVLREAGVSRKKEEENVTFLIFIRFLPILDRKSGSGHTIQASICLCFIF